MRAAPSVPHRHATPRPAPKNSSLSEKAPRIWKKGYNSLRGPAQTWLLCTLHIRDRSRYSPRCLAGTWRLHSSVRTPGADATEAKKQAVRQAFDRMTSGHPHSGCQWHLLSGSRLTSDRPDLNSGSRRKTVPTSRGAFPAPSRLSCFVVADGKVGLEKYSFLCT